EQIRKGVLTEKEALSRPRNALTRNLGAELLPQPDFFSKTLLKGDRVLLCSDGLWSTVSDNEIKQILRYRDSEVSAHKLVQVANEHGGYDNISAIVVYFDGIVTATSQPANIPSEGYTQTAALPASEGITQTRIVEERRSLPRQALKFGGAA